MFQTCDTETASAGYIVIFPKYRSDILSPIFNLSGLR